MRLELASFPVKNVRLEKTTSYADGILDVDRDEIISLILSDKKIASASLDLAFPGEHTRIVYVGDAVEPRLKVSGPGCIFPGIMGPVQTAGKGRTNRLSGIAVVAAARYSPTILGGTSRRQTGFIDMWGPGAQVTPLASTINVVLTLRLAENVNEIEAHTAIQMAEFRVANRLAETTRDKSPEKVETFELSKVDPQLPRVVYIMQVVSPMNQPAGYALYYGFPIRESFPTLVHPNEFFDGAFTADARQGIGHRATTWSWMNQPMVTGLLKEHGKRINFLGVIFQRIAFEAQLAKQIVSESAANMAELLGADSAIVTRFSPSGNSFIETMLTVQDCERRGIKTVLLTVEWGGREWTAEPSLIFYVPEATAMVSTGSFDHQLNLPAPKKVIGLEEGELFGHFPEGPFFSPWQEHTTESWGDITGGLDWWGGMDNTCQAF